MAKLIAIITPLAMARSFAVAVLLPNSVFALTYGIMQVTPASARELAGPPLLGAFLVVQFAGPFVSCAWYPAKAYERERSARTLMLLLFSVFPGVLALCISFFFAMAIVRLLGGGFPLPF
jgi:hypothetical protein